MNGLVESLMEELNCNVVFTIPLFGGIDVMESVVVTWIIMAIMMIASLILVRGLKVRNISKKQAALESGMSFIYDFFEGLFGKGRKGLYTISDYSGDIHRNCQYDWTSWLQVANQGFECDRFPGCHEHCSGGSGRHP